MCAAGKLPIAYGRKWPGRAKAEFKLAAVNQSSKSGQQGKFRVDHQRPVLAGTVSSRPSPTAVLRSDRQVGQRLLSACFANGPSRPGAGTDERPV
jgi:hypothetical protein